MGYTIRGLEGYLPLKGEGWHHPPCLCRWKGQGTATTASWQNILTGKKDDERGDIPVDGPATWKFELTDYSIQLLKEQWGLLLVGDGYTVKKVTIE